MWKLGVTPIEEKMREEELIIDGLGKHMSIQVEDVARTRHRLFKLTGEILLNQAEWCEGFV